MITKEVPNSQDKHILKQSVGDHIKMARPQEIEILEGLDKSKGQVCLKRPRKRREDLWYINESCKKW